MTVLPKNPYPGLRYYEQGSALLFAGRQAESRRCAQMIYDKNVVLLHGRTGCGKSSFLRAGVKPVLSAGGLGIGFADRDERSFDVIRSGRRPLNRLRDRIKSIIRSVDLEEGVCDIGPIRSGRRGAQALLQSFGEPDMEELIDSKMAVSGSAAYEVVRRLARFVENKPIFVIDQAEEVFSLAEKGNGGASRAPDSEIGAEANAEDAANRRPFDENALEVNAYFDFIKRVAREKGARLVVSMRTEYKGLFDDRLNDSGHDGDGTSGFFLRELEQNELVEAIERPTLNDQAWASLGYDGPSPRSEYGFVFEDGVAESIAEDLCQRDEIPSGGILPALQVTCLRLHKKILESKKRRGRSSKGLQKITVAQKRQIGGVKDQIREYVSEAIETECSSRLHWPYNVGRMADLFHRALASELAAAEADGRAVTAVKRRADIIDKITNDGFSERHVQAVGDVIDRLSHRWGILKSELTPGSDDPMLTLGHDSVALALNAWNLVHGQDPTAMMRMSMGMDRSAAELKREDLFYYPTTEIDAPTALPDDPTKVKVHVSTDFAWDHQLLQFAQTARDHGFAERLGITFEFPDDLDAVRAARTKEKENDDLPRSWPALRQNIIEKNAELRPDATNAGAKSDDIEGMMEKLATIQSNKHGWQDEYVLVPSEWSLFPGLLDDVDHDFVRAEHAPNWSDIAISSVSVSQSLIGQSSEKIYNLRRAIETSADGAARLAAQEELVRHSLLTIFEGGQVLSTGKYQFRFLALAARFVNLEPQFLTFMRSRVDGERVFKTLHSNQFTTDDPVVEWLLNGELEERDRFAIGGAASRAKAIQAGYQVYFSGAHLIGIGRSELALQQKGVRSDTRERIKDVAKELQNTVTHTIWQLGLPPSKWNQGFNRAFVLRLASIAYFTTEHARSNMAEFVLHLHSYVNQTLGDSLPAGADETDTETQRLSRDLIKSTVQDCFEFFRFDEVGPALFDLESPHAYDTNHAELNSRSIFGRVYTELVNLRKQTIANFERVAQSIQWLKDYNCYDPTDAGVLRAYKLKRLAWNNFKIFNFYDSDRYMARAAVAFETYVEQKASAISASVKRAEEDQA